MNESIKKMKEIFASFALLFILINVSAQEVEFSVIPAAQEVGTQDAFQVVYQIKNSNRVEGFRIEETKDIQILGGPARGSNISIINGNRSSSSTFTYIFKANRKGTITLPSGIIKIEGKEFKTTPTTIQVVEGSVRAKSQQRNNIFDDPFFNDPFGDDPFAAIQKQHQAMMQMMQRNAQGGQMNIPRPQAAAPSSANQNNPNDFNKANLNKNLFIKVDVDKTNVFVGEQITASYKIYTRLPMEINLTKLPSLIGFWSQDFKLPQIPKPTKTIYNGKEYQVFEIKRTALFPTQKGVLELDPAEAKGIARILKPQHIKQDNQFEDDPFFNMFNSMFMGDPLFNSAGTTTYKYEDIDVSLKSMPVSIHVSEIPTDKKPPSFNGAVGKYTIESSIDKQTLSTDDITTLTVKINGAGNLKMINPPTIKLPNDINNYDIQQADTILNTNNTISGYKTFKYSLSSQTPGTYEIPPILLTYYEPESKQFKTLETPSYTLLIKAGKQKNSIASLPNQIHDIDKKSYPIKKSSNGNVLKSPLYWSSFATPLLAFLLLFSYSKREAKLQSNTQLFKNKKANKIALKRLETAEKYLKLSAQNLFYEETSKAVWLYLSDKLNIPLSSLSKEFSSQKLTEKNISQELQKELYRVTNECEMALYTPDGGCMRMHQTYSDAFKLIGKLEDALS